MLRYALVGVAASLFIAPAMASDICKDYPQSEWMTKEAVTELATKMGYEIAGVKQEDGCWEIKGKKDGKRVEDYFDPVTGEVVESK